MQNEENPGHAKRHGKILCFSCACLFTCMYEEKKLLEAARTKYVPKMFQIIFPTSNSRVPKF